MVRQLAYESNCVGDQYRRVFREMHFSCERIERCEQSVFDKHGRSRHRSQDRRLSGVRVSDEARPELALPRHALDAARLLNILESLAQKLDTSIDESAV